MSEFRVPFQAADSEFVEKRSRFISHIWPVETEEQAQQYIKDMKARYYDARHNCWCYLIKDGPERYSDDGEPQGTAGIPMLEVFRREGITNAVCVVTRYFGGVLLGAGGLVRAYTRAAKDALEEAGAAEVRRWSEVSVTCAYSLAERVKQECAAMEGMVSDAEYAEGVTVKALLPEEQAEKFAMRIRDVTAGSAVCAVTGGEDRAVRIK